MARSLTAEEKQLGSTLSRLAIARGVITVLFGVFALVWPQITLATLAILITLWLLIAGVTGVIAAVLDRRSDGHWVFHLLVGLLQIGVGAYLIQRPGVTIATLVALVAIVLIAQGVVDAILAFVDRKSATHVVMTLIGALVSIIVGVLIWRYPVQGTLAFLWLLGLFAIVYGTILITMGIDVNREVKA